MGQGHVRCDIDTVGTELVCCKQYIESLGERSKASDGASIHTNIRADRWPSLAKLGQRPQGQQPCASMLQLYAAEYGHAGAMVHDISALTQPFRLMCVCACGE